MKSHKSTIKSFSLGCLCGIIVAILVVFGIATISVLKNGKEMIPGYLDSLNIAVTKHPWEGYDWSLDISKQGQYLLRMGKRKGADVADRCQFMGPHGELLVYMVWDDPEAAPGFTLHNDKMIIGCLGVERDNSEYRFSYGPYGLPPEKIHSGDVGYRDVDFDGQFDIKEVFNNDGTIQKTFILVNGDWTETTEFNRTESQTGATGGQGNWD